MRIITLHDGCYIYQRMSVLQGAGLRAQRIVTK
jgi:hypothetical protein